MEVTYRRDAGKSFMVVKEEDIRPDYQIEMCKRNQIRPFLALKTLVADGRLEFWYDITGRQSLEEYVRRAKLKGGDIELLMRGIIQAVASAENYLLEESSILLDPRYLFVDNSTKEVAVCFCPGEQTMFEEKFRALAEYLLAYVDHEQEQAVSLSYRMYQIALEPNYGISDIKRLLDEPVQMRPQQRKPESVRTEEKISRVREEEIAEEVQEEPEMGMRCRWLKAGKRKDRWGTEEKERERWKKEGKRLIAERGSRLIKRMFQRSPGDYQMVFEPMEETEQEEAQQTIFLGSDCERRKVRKLVYLGEEPGRDVLLEKESYSIGSRPDADIVIREETVSRLHARLSLSDGVYSVEDLNSKNGTWVNGTLLCYMEKAALRPDDIISFATERYRYDEEG